MKIKTTLKKLMRGDVVSIDWIDAGDIEDSSSSWFSQEDAEKVFKEIPVQTIAVYFGHGKENLFLVRDIERQDIKSPYFNGDSVGVAIARGFKKAGIEWGSFHHFRHFGACHMINNGEEIAVVSRWLGHKDISTTMIYARVNRDKLKLASKAFDEPEIFAQRQ